jgi:hypothetical protein
VAESLADTVDEIDVKSILVEEKNSITQQAHKMPQPDPYLVKFGNISRCQIVREYTAKHKCSDALAWAVIDLHLPNYRSVH